MYNLYSVHIGTCNCTTDAKTSFWVEELNLLSDHHDDILFGNPLNGDIVNASQILLSKQFPEVGGLQSTYYNNPPAYSRAEGVQIHYTGKYHWICSTTIGHPRSCHACEGF